MRGDGDGRYNLFTRNCQHFVFRLRKTILKQTQKPKEHASQEFEYPQHDPGILEDEDDLWSWMDRDIENEDAGMTLYIRTCKFACGAATWGYLLFLN